MGLWGGHLLQATKALMFLTALFPYGVFHYVNFLVNVLKIRFYLSNVRNLQKSELNDTTKPVPAVLKDTAATPRTYVLK